MPVHDKRLKLSASVKLLQWGLRQGLAGMIIAGTLLTIWSGFSLAFFNLGGTAPLGTANTLRITNPEPPADCCKKKLHPDDTLAVWDFYYTAKCSKTSKGSCASAS